MVNKTESARFIEISKIYKNINKIYLTSVNDSGDLFKIVRAEIKSLISEEEAFEFVEDFQIEAISVLMDEFFAVFSESDDVNENNE
jgi:hypothetical protein